MEAARVRDENASQTSDAESGSRRPHRKSPEAAVELSVRVAETLICSGQGTPLYQWQCSDVPGPHRTPAGNHRAGLRFVAQLLPFGKFDRLEIQLPAGRAVAQVKSDRMVFVQVATETGNPLNGPMTQIRSNQWFASCASRAGHPRLRRAPARWQSRQPEFQRQLLRANASTSRCKPSAMRCPSFFTHGLDPRWLTWSFEQGQLRIALRAWTACCSASPSSPTVPPPKSESAHRGISGAASGGLKFQTIPDAFRDVHAGNDRVAERNAVAIMSGKKQILNFALRFRSAIHGICRSRHYIAESPAARMPYGQMLVDPARPAIFLNPPARLQ